MSKKYLHAPFGALFAAVLIGTTPLPSMAESERLITVESSTIVDRQEAREKNPSSITVLSGEDIDAAHAENLQQTLQSIPGITTDIQTGDSIKIHIRGVENQRYMGERPGVAVVIDGVPVFERTGRVNIDLDNIESVKVIKGGASFLFGDDALSGAVIITTKRGAKMAGVKAQAEAGSYGYGKYLARVGHATEDYALHVQASRRTSDGYHFQSGNESNYVDGKAQWYINESSDLTFGFEVSKRKKDSHGTVEGVTQAEEDPKSLEGRDYARKFDVGLQKYHLTFARDFESGGGLTLSAYEYDDHTTFWTAPQNYDAKGKAVTDVDAYTVDNDYRQVQRGVKGEVRGDGEKVAWMAGIDGRMNRYAYDEKYKVDFKRSPRSSAIYAAGTQVGDNVTDEQVAALYAEGKYEPLAGTTLTLNGRYDNIALDYTDNLADMTLNKTFSVYSWRVGATQEALGGEFYTGISTGFRTPTVDQLFAGDISPTGNTASNPDLKPEQSLSFDIGYRKPFSLFGVGADIDVAVFQIERNDFIMANAGQYAIPEDGALNRFENIGGVRNRGLELSLVTDESKPLSFGVAYTYLNAVFTRYDNFNLVLGNRYGDSSIESFNLADNTVPRTPNHHLNLRVTGRPAPALSIAAEMDAISSYWADELNRNEIAGHAVFNLLVDYTLKSERMGTWNFFGRIDNIFDRHYYNAARMSGDGNGDGVYNDEDISITVNPGIIYTAGLSANF